MAGNKQSSAALRVRGAGAAAPWTVSLPGREAETGPSASNAGSTLRSGFPWKGDLDAASTSGFGHADAATVEIHRPAGDREAEPRAAVAARTVRGRRLAAVEALEDPMALRLGDAGALVDDLQLQRLGMLPAPCEHRDPAVRRAVLHGVVDQVGDHLVQALRVRVRRQLRRRHVEVQMDVGTRVVARTGGEPALGGGEIRLLQHTRQVGPDLETARLDRQHAVVE